MSDDLYFSMGSCALASIATCESAGHPYNAVRLEMGPNGAGEGTYATLSPLRQVPVLLTKDGPIRETGAILFYLDRLYPEVGLLPKDLEGRELAIRWLGFLGGTLHPTFRLLWRPSRYVGDDAAAQTAVRVNTVNYLAKAWEAVASDLGTSAWALGSESAIDYYLHVFTRWAIGARLSLPEALRKHHERVAAVPAMVRAVSIEASHPIKTSNEEK
jgi:glutathione S-transferase